jgi:hypothetical protein
MQHFFISMPYIWYFICNNMTNTTAVEIRLARNIQLIMWLTQAINCVEHTLMNCDNKWRTNMRENNSMCLQNICMFHVVAFSNRYDRYAILMFDTRSHVVMARSIICDVIKEIPAFWPAWHLLSKHVNDLSMVCFQQFIVCNCFLTAGLYGTAN